MTGALHLLSRHAAAAPTQNVFHSRGSWTLFAAAALNSGTNCTQNVDMHGKDYIYLAFYNARGWCGRQKMWNASRFCVSSLRRGHANLLCIVPILVYVLPKQVRKFQHFFYEPYGRWTSFYFIFYNVTKYAVDLSNRSGRVGSGGMRRNKLLLFREACL